MKQLVRLAASHLTSHTLTFTAPSAGQAVADPHATEVPHTPPLVRRPPISRTTPSPNSSSLPLSPYFRTDRPASSSRVGFDRCSFSPWDGKSPVSHPTCDVPFPPRRTGEHRNGILGPPVVPGGRRSVWKPQENERLGSGAGRGAGDTEMPAELVKKVVENCGWRAEELGRAWCG